MFKTQPLSDLTLNYDACDLNIISTFDQSNELFIDLIQYKGAGVSET